MLAFLASAVISAAPRWLDSTMAGYALAYDEKRKPVGLLDPKSGFYLVRAVECDGADLMLVLTRDRHVVANYGFEVPSLKGAESIMKIQVKPLPSLRTGKGISIGETPAAVRSRLGAPTKVEYDGARKQFMSYVYQRTEKGNEPVEVRQAYTFKAGRLIEISFSRCAE